MVKRFKQKYPLTISFRLKQHCDIIDKHLNPDEEIIYAFAAQKNYGSFDIVNTNAIALTNKRIMIATKRILWGYFFVSITPDMFNDLTVSKDLIWGSVQIDTIKETVTLSNIDPKALPEIETNITSYMMEAKKQYKTESN
jgi:hypothetical protein